MADGPVVAKAWVSIIPEISGAQAAITTGLTDELVPAGEKAGEQTGKKSSSSFASKFKAGTAAAGAALTAGVTVPLIGIGKQSFSVATEFENSMSQVAGAMDDPSFNLQEMIDLAKEMGATTIFSASQSEKAMVELAKGGLTQADIKGGALAATMDLAAAGNMNLADAANATVRAMGGFELGAGDTARIANSLAGSANASSADVSDLTYALAQCSASAHNAGWSIEDTTAMLGLFSDAGIVGSDAGTSLKTMLQRLQAPTDNAAQMMEQLGISVYDEQGHMRSATEVAQILQESLGGLEEEQRNAALAMIFGSDASRAATVLMNSGADGLAKYTDATHDSEAASRMAAAQLGESGEAMMRMEAATEAVQLALGQALAPVVTLVAEKITDLCTWFSNLDPGMQTAIVGGLALVAVLGPLVLGVMGVVGVLGTLAPILGGAAAAIGGLISPVGLVVVALVGLLATSEQFRDGIGQAFGSLVELVGSLLGTLWDTVSGVFTGIFDFVSGIFQAIFGVIEVVVGGIVGLVTGDFNFMSTGISNVMNGMQTALTGAWNSIASLVGGVVNGIADAVTGAWNVVSSITSSVFGGVSDTIKNIMGGAENIVSNALDAIAGFFRGAHFELPHINLPHFSISGGFSLNPLQVPHLSVSWYAKGGVFDKASVIGVGEDGPEAVVPLAGKRMEPFADAVADRIGERGGVTVQVAQLVVREEADIEKVSQRLYQLIERRRLVTA